jgi:hypothetical protein
MNLGTCHMHVNEYDKAVAYFEAQHAMATSLKLAHLQSDAALNMGVGQYVHTYIHTYIHKYLRTYIHGLSRSNKKKIDA